jgi:hypothetical protein
VSKPKRKEVPASLRSPERPSPSVAKARSDFDSHMREIVRNLRKADRDYSRTVQIVRQQARRARKQAHPIEAAVLDRISTLMAAPTTTEEDWAHRSELIGKLMAFLPLADEIVGLSAKDRKNWAIAFLWGLQVDPQSRAQLMSEATQKPGRPPSTRGFAIRAMELHRDEKDWALIAKSLPCDWTMVDKPGQSIRRQVLFLEGILQECGVNLETL